MRHWDGPVSATATGGASEAHLDVYLTNVGIVVCRPGESPLPVGTLDTRSITAALKGISAKELTIVAAFSEYQHEVSSDLALSDVRAVTEGKFTGPPITIRSNEARLTFDGKTFKTKQDR